MKRPLLLGYALLAYLWFLLDIVWSVAFVADVGPAPGIDDGPRGPVVWALVVDLVLLGVFAAHHSVMAREGAKRVLTRVVPVAAERSTFVLVADALLALVLWQWRPVDGTVWEVTGQPWQALLWAGYALGWVVAVASTFMIDHAELVGLRQATSHSARPWQATFREPWLYAVVRHPLMLGLLMAFWITPRMSVGHLVFAGASTAYVAVGIRLEERDLRRNLGVVYEDYATRVPALVPRPRHGRGRARRPGSAGRAGTTRSPAGASETEGATE